MQSDDDFEKLDDNLFDDDFIVPDDHSTDPDSASIRAEWLGWLRELEAKGVIRTAIGADGKMKYYVGKAQPKPDYRDGGNVAPLNNAARKRRREGRS